MARAPRLDFPGSYHHVMNRGGSHRPVFLDDHDRIEIGQRFADLYDRFGIEVLAYCLMGNHFHLLLHCLNGGLSDGMHRLASMYTRHVNDRHGFDGPLFRGRFRSRIITDDLYLRTACRYIHRNPHGIAGVTDIANYRWSSHRAYLGLRGAPPWLNTSRILDGFKNSDDFERFVRSDERVMAHRSPIVRIESTLGAARLVLAETGTGPDGDLGSMARLTTLAVLEGSPDIPRNELASVLEIPSAAALRAARSRARRAVQASTALQDAVRRTALLAG